MSRPISARNHIQTTLHSAQMMLDNRTSSQHVFSFLSKRLRMLSHPPSFIVVCWSGEGMVRNWFDMTQQEELLAALPEDFDEGFERWIEKTFHREVF